MPTYLLIRLASILIVIIASQAPGRSWTALVYSIALGHYVMSIAYSKRQVKEFLGRPLALLTMFSFTVFAAALYLVRLPLFILFGIHHAFNEGYVLKRAVPCDGQYAGAFRTSATLLHLFLYFVLLRHVSSIGAIDLASLYLIFLGGGQGMGTSFLWVGLTLSYAAFFYYLYQVRPLLSFRDLIENCGFELLGVVAVAASFFIKIQFLQIVLYHVVFWCLYPLPKVIKSGYRDLLVYCGMTGTVTAVFIYISPIGSADYRLPYLSFLNQFLFWSYVHITLSFVLSNANPSWLVELFRPGIEPDARPSGLEQVQPLRLGATAGPGRRAAS
jgi:hypothetical protein